MLHRLAATLILAVTLGCASKGTPRAARAPDVLTEQQLIETGSTDVLSALRRARPSWLYVRALDPRQADNGRGGISTRVPDEVQVYLDGTRFGGAAALETLPVTHINEIRFLSAIDATTRFGIGHGAGALLITTKR